METIDAASREAPRMNAGSIGGRSSQEDTIPELVEEKKEGRCVTEGVIVAVFARKKEEIRCVLQKILTRRM